MRTTFSLCAAVVIGLALAGCPSAPPDKDADPNSPSLPQITTKIESSGTIDAKKNKADWKVMTATVTGDATLTLTLPEGHKLKGDAGVFKPVTTGDKKPEAVAAKAITADDNAYTFNWQAEEGQTYLFKVAASSGAADYTISTLDITLPPPPDPCAGVTCGDNEECRDGKCITTGPVQCKPACKGKLVCFQGECIAPCGGSCPRGQMCDRDENTCVKDPCFGKSCPTGQRCSGGTCRAVTVTAKPCGGSCPAGEKCVNDACVKDDPGATPPEPSEAGPISGSIVTVTAEGKRSVLFINRGSQRGIKAGMKGTITGVSGTFEVVEVYEFRCKAIISVDAATIGDKKAVVIQR